jgi:hypothetical protein
MTDIPKTAENLEMIDAVNAEVPPDAGGSVPSQGAATRLQQVECTL